MSTLLEQAFIAVLNKEEAKADELFHQFVVERARKIHESLRQGEDSILDENWEDSIKSEEYFSEDMDGMDPEDDGMDEAEEMAPEASDEMDAPEGEEVEAVDEVEPEEFDLDKFEELGDNLARLNQLYAELTGQAEPEEMEPSMDGDMEAGEEMEPEADVEDELGEGFDIFEDDDSDEEDDSDEDDTFEDVTEAALTDLDKVKAKNTDGLTTAGKVPQNDASALPQKKIGDRLDTAGPKDLMSKERVYHTGYEMEKAPAVKDMGVGKNVRKKSTDDVSKVKATGEKTETTDGSAVKTNDVSPIGSKGTVKSNKEKI